MSLQVFPQFRVIDECDHWLVVDKAAPLIVHPTNRKDEPTLLGGIEQLLSFEIQNGACPAVAGSSLIIQYYLKPALYHRTLAPTSSKVTAIFFSVNSNATY